MSKYSTTIKLSISVFLITCIIVILIFPHFMNWEVKAADQQFTPGDTVVSGLSDNWHHYCIDGYEVLGEAGGILGDGELYQYVLPSTQLSKQERNILFWSTLSMLAGKGTSQELHTIYNNINTQAPASGLMTLTPAVTEADLKKIIHKPSVLNKYPWINTAIANAETYMKLGGILNTSANTTSMEGKTIPAILQGRNTLDNALPVDGTYTIQFDAGGADKDFIHTVPLEFSSSGIEGSWEASPIAGWNYTKTDTAIIFHNQSVQPSGVFIRFNTQNTAYAVAGGSFSSVEEAYENGLQLWVCIACNNAHITRNKTMPLEAHQRMVYMEMASTYSPCYAVLGSGPVTGQDGGGLQFKIYRHEEEMISTYNVQLNKYDYETGKPLEHAVFKLYERFDDKADVNTDRDGSVHIYEGGDPYKSYHTDNPVIWNDFRYVASVSTDENGYASKTINHGYHYDKTFCDGHPAPVFVTVPNEEYDDEGDLENGAEIDAAQAENQKLAKSWQDCMGACESQAWGDFEGVHFHWLMPSVDESKIGNILSSGGSPGETPNAGTSTSATGDESYEKSGCRKDCEDTYDKFISLKYSYTWVEYTAREGYIRHSIHTDDIPIEVITTDSSENGANASFAGSYSETIKINTKSLSSSAEQVLTAKIMTQSQTSSVREAKGAVVSFTRPMRNYVQKIVSFRVPLPESEESSDDEGWNDVVEILNDMEEPAIASGSDAVKATLSNASVATASNAAAVGRIVFTATASNASLHRAVISRGLDRAAGTSQLFTSAYQTALNGNSSGTINAPGDDSLYSHCNDADGEGDIWRIFDHRTEGEIHINKRDMELESGETAGYDSYGDAQGDATVEGAVYGLFAASDIIHPDGITGTVYQANNLVAVAATDKNGDASFLSCTEAPGYCYDYNAGKIAAAGGGWAQTAPANLYINNSAKDDYTEDGKYQRSYTDNRSDNGNCWIGRPLIMGDYYIKELSRSEGYELSIGNRKNEQTNYGQEYNVSIMQGDGYAVVTKNLYAEGQISEHATGEYGDPDYDELFFFAESQGTGANGFDIALSGIPKGAVFYRLDSAVEIKQVEAGTGVYDKVYLTNSDGSPKYATAESDYQYPRYNQDGTLMTEEIAVNYQASQFSSAEWIYLSTDKTLEAIEEAESAMTAEQILTKLATDFTASDLLFLKGKVEKALRRNGKQTPKITSGGTIDYSSMEKGIFDEGVRAGDFDPEGISGCQPGQVAEQTVYGSPVIIVEISAFKEDDTPVTIGEVILSVLDFYNTNSFYDYGGVHSVAEDNDKFLLTLYASRNGNPGNFIALGTDETEDSVIHHRTEYIPGDPAQCPRYVYVTYSNNSQYEAFGTYEDFHSEWLGNRYYVSAELITDAVISADGMITSRTVTQNVYYQTGEIPCDASGNKIRAFEYREQTSTVEVEVENYQWVRVAQVRLDGKCVVHIDSSYRDVYGKDHRDDLPQSYRFRIVVPEKNIVLTQEDLDVMYGSGIGWSASDRIGGAVYYLRVAGAEAKAYLNYADHNITGDNSYIKAVSLLYPGDTYSWQDGTGKPGLNTRINPVGVQERVIKQQIKVFKAIDQTTYENADSFGTVHRDWFSENFSIPQSDTIDNFRFKIYLKSNLEHLYRDQDGTVIWQDRNGNPIDILEANHNYPALSGKIFTKAPHQTTPLYKDSDDAVIHHNQLYDYTDGLIHETQNNGSSLILEVLDTSEAGYPGSIYNYEKFFDAIAVANADQWDNGNPTYTSDKPVGNEANTSEYTRANAGASDRVRQFAVTWYLKDEQKKLTHLAAGYGEMVYQQERYDEALYHAITKADNYLKPFFAYDFDEIYAVSWDREGNGGSDRDPTTLTVDIKADSCSGISRYLPYGTYIVVEQQPAYDPPGDFKNRHYQIDKPREVALPAVYLGAAGTGAGPEEMSSYYFYNAEDKMEDLERKYHIRFGEETQVIKAHNQDGDYQIYKYGLDIDQISNGVPVNPGAGDYFAVTQAESKPDKNYYNDQNDRNSGPVLYYLAEGLNGRTGVSGYYRFSSISEDDKVINSIRTMKGIQTAWDGYYAPMLVPYTIMAPSDPGASGWDEHSGFACTTFRNQFYTAKLRIEKLDADTGENILHDQAIFALYAASRDDGEEGHGNVLFHEQPTILTGSKEFLEAMGAEWVYPAARGIIGALVGKDTLWFGMVPAGTPVCVESERIVLTDQYGNKTGSFQAFTTLRDGAMISENEGKMEFADQNTGYLELPQSLGAGVYVLAEIKPPDGYVRSKPIAVEVYSDQVTYYQNGSRDNRVAAVIYKDVLSDRQAAQIYVANTPVRVQISKKKADDKTVTYQVSGRVEGSITELNGKYGLENLELAYNASGTYLGYGWKKGMLEYLYNRKKLGENVTLCYEKGTFAGYGEITRPLESGQDQNRYVSGAVMTLYDAIEVTPSQDIEDYAYTGVEVVRDRNSNVTGMYVKSVYAGFRTEFMQEDGVWSYKTIRRPDTDILFYDLGGLDVLKESEKGEIWSYGRDGSRQRIISGATTSIYAKKQNQLEYEIVSSDFSALGYDPQAKAFTKTGQDTIIYHLDEDGNRDAMVHPYTGMAYVKEGDAVMVWTVRLINDEYGNVISREKQKTSRIASIHADTDQEYIVGTYQRSLQQFLHQVNPVLDEHGLLEYFSRFPQTYIKGEAVYDRDGDFMFDRYDDRLWAFNRNAYMVKDRESVFDKGVLWDPGDNREELLYMRQGEHYIMENTWVSGEKFPNDPFLQEMAAGQPDMLKRVIPGTYILEEIKAPEGYAKTLPTGFTVKEIMDIQESELSDEIIKVEIDKIDSPQGFRISGRDHDKLYSATGVISKIEGKGGYTYQRIPGVTIALFPARRVYTTDLEAYSGGWYLEKLSDHPVSWTVYDENGIACRQTARWTTADEPIWLEGIPAGTYLLEELEVPDGYIKTSMELVVEPDSRVQTIIVSNDHTKLELYKYQTVEGKREALPNSNSAVLSLYESVQQPENLIETWTTNDCRQYTEVVDLGVYGKTSFLLDGEEGYSGFQHDFEAMYGQYGVRFNELHWYYTESISNNPANLPELMEGRAVLETYQIIETTGCVRQHWKTDEGKEIIITISPNRSLVSDSAYSFEYQYHVNRLDNGVISYDLAGGVHRIDYLRYDPSQPQGKIYILAETKAPEGYLLAEPKIIRLEETADIQIYGLENKPDQPTVQEEPEEPTTDLPEETTQPPAKENPEESTQEPEKTEPQTSQPIPETEPESSTADVPGKPSRPQEATEPVQTVPQSKTKETNESGYITARYDGGDYQAQGLEQWVRWLLAKAGDGSCTWILITLIVLSGGSLVIWRRRKRDGQAEEKD
ncbi:MAG: SpaA isopeptide-forming pilin-related protein [Lachnospiraceae bacterium]